LNGKVGSKLKLGPSYVDFYANLRTLHMQMKILFAFLTLSSTLCDKK